MDGIAMMFCYCFGGETVHLVTRSWSNSIQIAVNQKSNLPFPSVSSSLGLSHVFKLRLQQTSTCKVKKKRQGRKKKGRNGREVNRAGEGKKLCSSNEIFLFCLSKIPELNVKMPGYAVKSMLSLILVNLLKNMLVEIKMIKYLMSMCCVIIYMNKRSFDILHELQCILKRFGYVVRNMD